LTLLAVEVNRAGAGQGKTADAPPDDAALQAGPGEPERLPAPRVTQGALDWRWAWLGFAAAGGVLAAIARACLPKGRAPAPDPERAGQRSFFHRDTVPLYGAALVFGATNAVFLSFAADRVVGAGGLPGLPDRAAAAVIFLGYGVFGLVGLATRRIEAGIGLAALCCAIFAAAALSLALIALAPGSWTAVIAASGLHGAAIIEHEGVMYANWANSLAMEQAGITAETPDPEGGRIMRDAEGNPNGVFIDNAIALVGEFVPAFAACLGCCDAVPLQGLKGLWVHSPGRPAACAYGLEPAV